MSLFKPVRKAAKFTFVTIPSGLFGWTLNKRLFGWLTSYWRRSTSPACPECDSGVLLVQVQDDGLSPEAEGDGAERRLYPWVCTSCGHALLEERNPVKVREVVAVRRRERLLQTLGELRLRQRQDIAKRHKVASRIFFAVAMLTFLNFVRLLAMNVSFIVAANWASFALMFFVFGMKSSYRAWQVVGGHLFEEGAFWHWFKHEKWLA